MIKSDSHNSLDVNSIHSTHEFANPLVLQTDETNIPGINSVSLTKSAPPRAAGVLKYFQEWKANRSITLYRGAATGSADTGNALKSFQLIQREQSGQANALERTQKLVDDIAADPSRLDKIKFYHQIDSKQVFGTEEEFPGSIFVSVTPSKKIAKRFATLDVFGKQQEGVLYKMVFPRRLVLKNELNTQREQEYLVPVKIHPQYIHKRKQVNPEPDRRACVIL